MRRIIYFFFAGGLILAVAFFALYNKPHRQVADEKGISITASDLFNRFSSDETSANKAYLDKVLSVTGKVVSVQDNQQGGQVVILETSDLMFGVSCTMEKSVSVTKGSEVTMKGFCKGYLSDVVLTNCILE